MSVCPPGYFAELVQLTVSSRRRGFKSSDPGLVRENNRGGFSRVDGDFPFAKPGFDRFDLGP